MNRLTPALLAPIAPWTLSSPSLRFAQHFALAVALVTPWVAFDSAAQILPPTFDQNAFLYNTNSLFTNNPPPCINWQSLRGVPISTNAADPGSDGRAPTAAQQLENHLTQNLPSSGQFRGVVSFAAVSVQGTNLLNPNTSFAQNVEGLDWPRIKDTGGNIVAILRAAQVGAPYMAKSTSYPFGSEIPVPLTDENGLTLTNEPNYWLPAPYTCSKTITEYSTNWSCYYSPYANKVFATQPGQISIVWQKTVPSGSPSTNPPANVGILTNGGSYYILYTNLYLVSGEPVKTPQKMFWTEGSRAARGHAVTVPPGVTANIIYNSSFPEKVAPPGDTAPNANPYYTTSTLWVDSNHQLRADNSSGRAFIELLGPRNTDGSMPFLGFEIADVFSDPVPTDVRVELGTRIPAYQDRRDDSQLVVAPFASQSQFYYSKSIPNSANVTLYATRITFHLNDFEAYWLISGVAGIQWPYLFNRYQEFWPADVGEYVNYVRPAVTTDAEAAQTAVQLPAGETPSIAYQDDPVNPRAFLLSSGLFHTFLDTSYPTHRTLLQFISGNNVAYERVFSWLDTNLRSTNFTGTLATNLTAVNDYLRDYSTYSNYLVAVSNYTVACSNYTNYSAQSYAYNWYDAYTNYLAGRSRGVNGEWRLYVSDDSPGGWGSIASWTLVVETTNSETAQLVTNEFTNANSIMIYDFANADPYPSTITVSGISNDVTAVRVRLTGFTHAFPEDVDAFLVAPQSNVCTLLSDASGGVGWSQWASSNSWSSVATSSDGTKLVATVRGGNIYTSGNSGTNWTSRGTSASWFSVASSTNGAKLVAAAFGGQIRTSTDAGAHWTTRDQSRNWTVVASSADGTKLVAVNFGNTNTLLGGDIYTSTNGGTNWTAHNRSNLWCAVASSADGNCLVAAERWSIQSGGGASIYRSTDGGITWTSCYTNPTAAWWKAIACSADGTKLVAADQYEIYTSSDGGTNWTPRMGGEWSTVASSADGATLVAASSEFILISTDFGANWAVREGTPWANWSGLALSANGTRLVATVDGGPIYTYDILSVTNVDLLLDDAAAAPLPAVGPLGSGAYRPTDYAPDDFLPPDVIGPNTASLAALLLPVPVPVPVPPQPWVTNPPAVIPNPGTQPVPALGTNESIAPRVISATVNVGDRLVAPGGEIGSTNGSTYLAGYIIQAYGKSFNPGAYLDPFVVGFGPAAQGAIIPVNAIPGSNTLVVLWFRSDNANAALGFQSSYWPAVIGQYHLQWPANAPEIIMARMGDNAGSGDLTGLQAQGSIYRQPDPALPGYNPNEEHALMLAGKAYALRDDLNITNLTGYTSDPFVLISYTGTDGRPAMAPFHVRREAPEQGILFDYVVEAGKVLQGPMPLPLLAPPVDGLGANAINYNQEPAVNSGDLPVGFTDTSPLAYYRGFTLQDRKREFWVYRGLHSGPPLLQAGAFNTTSNRFDPFPNATAVLNQPFTYYIHVSRQPNSLTNSAANLPYGLTTTNTASGWAITGVPTIAGSNQVSIVTIDTRDNSSVTNSLSLSVVSSGTVVALGPLVITSTNQYSGATVTYTDRPLYLAQSPTTNNSFTMRFYYKNQALFDWPAPSTTPTNGAIVPYLRPRGSPDDPTSKNTASLDIVYRPVWPSSVPALSSGQTLTVPVPVSSGNLAGVRGQSSVQVLYQQSLATNGIAGTNQSVTLFDPTVQKTSSLTNQGLSALPAGVNATMYQGRYYFQNLPPNLVNRLYFDPNTAELVLKGQFVAETVGDSYLLLNVLAGADLAAAEGLCPTNDPNYAKWVGLVTNLATSLYMRHENPATPGSYVVDTNRTLTKYVSDLVNITNSDQQVDSYALSATGPGLGYITYIVGNTLDPVHAGEPVTVCIARVATPLWPGQLKVILDPNPLSESISFQHTVDLAGKCANYEYDWRYAPPVAGQPPTTDPTNWTQLTGIGTDLSHYTLGGASGLVSLGDNYVTVRYREIDPLASPDNTKWSDWTGGPDHYTLAEGYIKRVLAGINPFNQRTADLFGNPVNTTGDIISQAGTAWEGDVALNAQTITNAGLIAIYETVLHRGEDLSINAGYNYGPANNALLLAAGYLSDLYSMVANDAAADAANPTIGIGTADRNYGSIATALFSFQGQEPSLLEENLALLRGRDDSLSPGVQLRPVYNRLYWNYTRGIDAGEVIYALNYNILDQNNNGVVNAADAAIRFPMGHGDAYGHYLTALGNYYALLMNANFDWVPTIETVSVLGAPVSVGYQHERKFAATAASLARTGLQVFDLTWRENYKSGTSAGWSYLDTARTNSQRSYTNTTVVPNTVGQVTSYWGLDHWAARTAQGAYLNWVVGNAILPDVDTNTTHQGIQKVDRTTVPELTELPRIADQLQADMNNAEAGFTPFDLSQNAIPFDIDPLLVTGPNPQTHFEQVYARSVTALNNAVVAFDDAQNVTQLMRSEEDSLADLQAGVTAQELAYNNQLIELYGTPYPDDMGPGKTYAQDYNGPDLLHYTYVETPDRNNYNGVLPDPTVSQIFYVDTQQLPLDWSTTMYNNFDFIYQSTAPGYTNYATNSIPLVIGPDGFLDKPAAWTSRRNSPGEIQQAISALVAAEHDLRQAAANATGDKAALDKAMNVFTSQIASESNSTRLTTDNLAIQSHINNLNASYNEENKWMTYLETMAQDVATTLSLSTPTWFVAGTSVGSDAAGKPVSGAFYEAAIGIKWALYLVDTAYYNSIQNKLRDKQNEINANSTTIANMQLDADTKNAVLSLGTQLGSLQNDLVTINTKLRAVSDALAAYQTLVAKGNRIQSDRLTYRQHAAALVQGYRTRDAAFRVFQNEKLQRYLTLFNLASKYAFLAAQAYDYETGLLGTSQGQAFLRLIISAQALGVVANGQPQYSSSTSGDPGLAGALAQMKGDWDVLKGRLGFNNPDGYGTTVSLRSENYRILSNTNGDSAWQQVLQQGRVADLRADADVKRNCLQIDDGSGTAVPGIILSFGTTIANGVNLFGNQLAAGDHNFSPSSFATKIFATGVCLDGYIGMDNPTAGGGTSPPDPTLDPNALAATPYVYLIPVGQDSMRSPPLGDASNIRSWNVDDVTIPLPFNVSAAAFSTTPFYTSANSLSEPLFAVREHQAFRPVSTTSVFNTSIYGANGALQPSQYTNKRLIGRSIWNSKWKLVIPGRTLLADPNEGLDHFIQSVKDIHLYFITYSYAGN
jgi:hypothetical protein